jgi:hypothetical protein
VGGEGVFVVGLSFGDAGVSVSVGGTVDVGASVGIAPGRVTEAVSGADVRVAVGVGVIGGWIIEHAMSHRTITAISNSFFSGKTYPFSLFINVKTMPENDACKTAFYHKWSGTHGLRR